jgi:hypothetical protein
MTDAVSTFLNCRLEADLPAAWAPRRRPALLDPHGFQGKHAQPGGVALTGLRENDDVVRYRQPHCRVAMIRQSQLAQDAFESINQDSSVYRNMAILAMVDE